MCLEPLLLPHARIKVVCDLGRDHKEVQMALTTDPAFGGIIGNFITWGGR